MYFLIYFFSLFLKYLALVTLIRDQVLINVVACTTLKFGWLFRNQWVYSEKSVCISFQQLFLQHC